MTPTLVYDGDCAFCTASVRAAERLGLDVGRAIPWQHADLVALGLTRAECEEAVQLVEPGRRSSGHEAVGRLLRTGPWWCRPVGALLLAPPAARPAARLYRWVADHRDRLPGGTPACAVPQADPGADPVGS